MIPEYDQGDWYQVDPDPEGGVSAIPADMVSKAELKVEYPEAEIYYVPEAIGARLSAPGYMDCTDWVLFFGDHAEAEARDHIEETYNVNADTGEDLPED